MWRHQLDLFSNVKDTFFLDTDVFGCTELTTLVFNVLKLALTHENILDFIIVFDIISIRINKFN